MNKIELKKRLIEAGIRKDAWSIDEGFSDETYKLEQDNDGWSVYYSERGIKRGLKKFSTESEACDYFLKTVTNDSTTQCKS